MQNQIQREVNGPFHPFFLRPPGGAQDRARNLFCIFSADCFHLGKKPAKITDKIRTLEIGWEPNECFVALTPRTLATICNKRFAKVTKDLPSSSLACVPSHLRNLATNHH
jgi:hypothetical protein